MSCGRPLKDTTREYCKDCEKGSHSFTQAKAVYEYYGPMKDAMYRFKYDNRRAYGKAFARDAWMTQGDWIRSIRPKLIVPVPMHHKKEQIRGYNQAAVFAHYLAKETGIPCKDDLILRSRDTKPLKTLTPGERRANLKEAFSPTKCFRRDVDILIVDDIFTTGATVDEVTEALKTARAGRVYGLFICIGRADL